MDGLDPLKEKKGWFCFVVCTIAYLYNVIIFTTIELHHRP